MFDFDLQRFADGPAGEGAQGGGEPQGQQETEGRTTLLGGAGLDNNAQNQQGQQPQSTSNADINYDFSGVIPEGWQIDEQMTNSFAEIARGCNLNQEQAAQMADFGIKYAQNIASQVQAEHEAQVQEWGKTAQQELGADFQKVVSQAGKGIEALEKQIPNLRQFLNETGVGNRIEAIRILSFIGDMVSEDSSRIEGNGVPQQSSPYPNTNFDLYK